MPRGRKKVAYAGSLGSGQGGKRGRSGSRKSISGSIGGGGAHAALQDEIRKASQAAERAKMSSMRRNRTFIQIKRDMEDRSRHAAKTARDTGEIIEEVMYVDRDRAAAVTLGTKDIRSDIKGKRFTIGGGDIEEEADDDSWIFTYIKQGQYELKKGDPNRALMYFDKAVSGLSQYFQDEILFVLRSECHIKLGNYEMADADADAALRIDAFCVKGLISKAEAQYNLGNFEHALKFFHRAQDERPGYNNVEEGLHKTRSAIENTLSSHLDFLELEDIIKQIISDPSLDLGYDYQPANDTSKFELNEEDKKDLDIPEAICEEPDNWETESSDSDSDPRKKTIKLLFPEPTDFDGKRRRSSILEVHLIDANLHKMMGIRRPSDQELAIQSTLMSKAQSAKEALIQKRKSQKRAYNATEIRLAERQLLGKLHADHIYLRNFVNSNLLKKAYAVHGEDDVPSSTHTKILQTAKEGLAFLEKRKTWWQQQEPVFARKLRSAKGLTYIST